MHVNNTAAKLKIRARRPRARFTGPRPALMLSGGGMVGNTHIGVVKVLLKNGLLPSLISGASAGAYVAAILGTHNDVDIARLFRDDAALLSAERSTAPISGMSSTDWLRLWIEQFIPDMTFAEGKQVSGRTIAIIVTPEGALGNAHLLSALTTPNILIRDAVLASCAVPFLIEPLSLRSRGGNGKTSEYKKGVRFIDGSISADLPADQLRSVFKADITIASIANPLVLPFIIDPIEQTNATRWVSHLGRHWARQIARRSSWLIRSTSLVSSPLSLALMVWSRVVDQSYLCDINILSPQRFFNPFGLIGIADQKQLKHFISQGAKSATRKLPEIKRIWNIESKTPQIDLQSVYDGTCGGAKQRTDCDKAHRAERNGRANG
jgi:TAG lipase/steryl ester hydrolase/phospholipase A2/LPA acyltransferase